MRATRWFWYIALAGCGLAASASAEEAVRWQVSLDTAKRLASQTNRLVLIHFWADWCEPCRQMEQEVFTQPGFASRIESYFVPVRINADHFPRTREQFGITVLPTEVIMTPEGQVVSKIDGVVDAREYFARLDQVVAVALRPGGYQSPSSAAMSGDRWSPAPAQHGPAVGQPPGYPPSGRPVYPDGSYGGQRDRQEQADLSLVGPRYAGSAGPASPDYRSRVAGPATPPSMSQDRAPAIQLPPGNPPLGLDGYCPVELSESRRWWVLGDPRWGLIHRGRTYLFAGPEQRDRFDADPDRYAPLASGHDVVLLVEQGQLIPGRREHGGWFEDRVYLFSSPETYLKFHAAPREYVRRLLEMSGEPNVARRPTSSLDFNRPPAAREELSRGWR